VASSFLGVNLQRSFRSLTLPVRVPSSDLVQGRVGGAVRVVSSIMSIQQPNNIKMPRNYRIAISCTLYKRWDIMLHLQCEQHLIPGYVTFVVDES
jgi:hypothetical protein